MKADGDWFHSHQEERIVRAIEKTGWRPDLNTGTKFGCGIYLGKGQWHPDAKWMIRCKVNLRDDEIIDIFPVIKGFEAKGSGNSEGHFERYLKSLGVTPGRAKVEKGDSQQNQAIRDHFLKRGIKGVIFVEHDEEVFVVYDKDAIQILDIKEV
jgi:hypothetical protein